MSELEDFKLDKPIDEPTDPPEPRWKVWWLAVAAVLLVLAVAGGYIALRQSERREPPAASAETQVDPPPTAGREPGDGIVLPPLDDTDPLVRELVRQLSSHPRVAAWLATDGLLLSFALVTLRIADGETPVRELRPLAPASRFRTRVTKGVLYLDPSSYERYNGHADAVASLDPRGTARLYATLTPRINDAYRRIGESDGDFGAVLERAVVELLEVPVVEGQVQLTPRTISYAFADPRLEALSPAQKQLLRMGPRNVRLVQSKLREIASSLGIPDARLPK